MELSVPLVFGCFTGLFASLWAIWVFRLADAREANATYRERIQTVAEQRDRHQEGWRASEAENKRLTKERDHANARAEELETKLSQIGQFAIGAPCDKKSDAVHQLMKSAGKTIDSALEAYHA